MEGRPKAAAYWMECESGRSDGAHHEIGRRELRRVERHTAVQQSARAQSFELSFFVRVR